jgi:hypothetical protein
MSTAMAWAFLVVSDPQQAESLRDQETWAKETAAERGWVLTRTIAGVSTGRDGPRKLALGMISELEALEAAQRPCRVVMIRLERLGRGDGLEAMEAFLRLRRLGIVVHTRLDGDVDAHRASELLMPVLRFFIGGMENEVRRDKLLSLYERRRQARLTDPTIALSAMAPYGLRYDHGRLVPVAGQANVVRCIFELRCRGYGHGLIAKRIGSLATPMVSKSGRERRRSFSSDAVRAVVINPRYRGTIVSDELWLEAQKPARAFTPARGHYEYSMGGALRCECGEALVGNRASGNRSMPPRPHLYYQCRNAPAHDGHMKHHRCERIDAQFVELLKRLRAEDELVTSYLRCDGFDERQTTLQTRLSVLRADVADFDDRRRTIMSAYEDGRIPSKDLKWRLGELRAKHAEARDQIGQLERELAAVEIQRKHGEHVRALLDSAADLWLSAPIEERRALAKAVCACFGGCVVTIDGTLVLRELALHV